MPKPELLIPAGNLEALKAAVVYGADAVYIGGEDYSLRKRADNFTPGDMSEGIAFAHSLGKKVYVTVNVYARDAELTGLRSYLTELSRIRPDALIIADPGVMMLSRELCPGIDIHISTQANAVNSMDFKFWGSMGAKRVVAARELSLKEIEAVGREAPGVEIECFIHGAMCISYSGRCLLSAYMTGKSANSGSCTHPCRWKYTLYEETRPTEGMPVDEDERGTYILNSRDLCMAEYIPELIGAGIDALKVEGRMKSLSYAAITAMVYRRAIDECLTDPALYKSHIPDYLAMLSMTTHRPFSTGFYFGAPGKDGQIYCESTYLKDYTYLGIVSGTTPGGDICIKQKNKFSVGDDILVIGPGMSIKEAKVIGIRDRASGEKLISCPHAGEELIVSLDCPAGAYDILIARTK